MSTKKSKRYPHRFTHEKNLDPIKQRSLVELGQKQAAHSVGQYHYLCAAIQQTYTIQEVPPDLSRAQLFPRKGVVFSSYPAYKLEPILGIKLHPRGDGTIHPEDLKIYGQSLRKSWKCREAGVMYCLEAEPREAWNMVLNYHSSAGTTGIKAWDDLFKRMKQTNYNKGIVPCMFFAREAGCLDPKCPFLHDTEACIRDREKVLMKRRATLGRPTMRDISLRRNRQLKAHREGKQQLVPASPDTQNIEQSLDALALRDSSDDIDWDDEDEDDLDPEVRRIFDEAWKIRKICSNPECLNVKLKKKEGASNDVKMMNCSRCKVATYCSQECQRADWKRHKNEPCLPFDELVENDDLWTTFGERKGTGHVNVHFNED